MHSYEGKSFVINDQLFVKLTYWRPGIQTCSERHLCELSVNAYWFNKFKITYTITLLKDMSVRRKSSCMF